MVYRWGIDEELFSKYFYEGATIQDLQQIFNISKRKVNVMIGFLHLKRSRTGINFDNLKLHNLKRHQCAEAYMIGFLYNKLMVDKSVYRMNYIISFNDDELEIMKGILAYLNYDGVPYRDPSNGRWEVHFNDLKFMRMMQMYGMGFEFKHRFFPRFRHLELGYHFIRGYIDGGGGFISTKSKIPYIKIYGPFNFLRSILWFAEINKNKVNINRDGKVPFMRLSGKKFNNIINSFYTVGDLTLEKNYVKIYEMRNGEVVV